MLDDYDGGGHALALGDAALTIQDDPRSDSITTDGFRVGELDVGFVST